MLLVVVVLEAVEATVEVVFERGGREGTEGMESGRQVLGVMVPRRLASWIREPVRD